MGQHQCLLCPCLGAHQSTTVTKACMHPHRVLVSSQAQCILFRRYPAVLEPFKYAGYPLLLQAVTLPEADDATEAGGKPGTGQPHWLAPESIPQLQVLLWIAQP